MAHRIIEKLGVPWVCLLSMDSFYKVLGPEEHELANANNYNFDHPGTLSLSLLPSCVQYLTGQFEVSESGLVLALGNLRPFD